MSPTPDQMGHFLVDDPENEIFSPIFDFGKRGNGQLDRIESKLDRILNILEPIETEFRLQRLGLHPVKDANIINTFRSSYLFTFKEKK